ncbi:hypothetical protein RZS08_48385 [Arthrospira platensis SPKY1]|nr:hypothetical protein [Arthrospira platensis SPKY1]
MVDRLAAPGVKVRHRHLRHGRRRQACRAHFGAGFVAVEVRGAAVGAEDERHERSVEQ